MQRSSRYGWWSAASAIMLLLTVTMIVLAPSFGQRRDYRELSSHPIDDWSMVELVKHLNRTGVELQLRSTQGDGVVGQTVFLTTIDKDWNSLNALNKDSKRIREWSGILSCQRMGDNSIRALHLFGDRCLVAGPFLFYGDPHLLDRVRSALGPFITPAAL